MNSLLKTSCLALALVLVGATAGFADSLTTVNFTDTHNYWLQGQAGNWANGLTPFGYNEDNIDVIGTPNFIGGSVSVGSYTDRLSSISVNYTNGSGLEQIGDLFLDTNSDNYWDYVVQLYNAPGHANGAAGVYNVYAIHLDATQGTAASDAARYDMTGNSNTGIWTGYVIRDNEPFAINPAQLVGNNPVGQVTFNGWDTVWGPNTSTFSFDQGFTPQLSGSTPMTLAWEPNCANDVLYEAVNIPPPVPEPSTLLLLSSGLAGLFWFGRKRNMSTQMSAVSF